MKITLCSCTYATATNKAGCPFIVFLFLMMIFHHFCIDIFNSSICWLCQELISCRPLLLRSGHTLFWIELIWSVLWKLSAVSPNPLENFKKCVRVVSGFQFYCCMYGMCVSRVCVCVLVCFECFEGGDRQEAVQDHSPDVVEQQQQCHTPAIGLQEIRKHTIHWSDSTTSTVFDKNLHDII